MWQPIETAPKDGTLILLLSRAYTNTFEDGEVIHHEARANLGMWNAEGTSWVDENGMLGGECYTLATTGTWSSGGGWFQPNEVTHWAPIPDLPKLAEST